MNPSIAQLPPYQQVPEPELIFHPDRPTDVHVHPLEGLVEFGPFSRSLVNSVIDPIRVATISPEGDAARLDQLLKELECRHIAQERRAYLPEFPGFSRVFGIKTVKALSQSHISIPASLDKKLNSAERPHLVLAEQLSGALAQLQGLRNDFDAVLVYLPSRWKECFKFRNETEDFDLHDHLKAVCAVRGIPLQIVREDNALAYPCRCSVMWRLGLALYAKAGGVPWKLANAPEDIAFIGISYALRNQAADRRFVTCCSQVFDADGAGLEFILYETSDARVYGDNPFLTRGEMRRVMARSLALYQRRHAGKTPKRIIVHKSTEFKPYEVDGCFDVWQSSEGLELIQIQQDVIWRGIKIDAPRSSGAKKGAPSNYPCERGSYLQIGPHEVLLWTQGNASAAARGKNFFKEGKGIPSPLVLRKFAGHEGWDQQCGFVLGLTKMNWNNDGLYDRLPVTLGYASVLARTVKRMSNLAHRPYQLRFFM